MFPNLADESNGYNGYYTSTDAEKERIERAHKEYTKGYYDGTVHTHCISVESVDGNFSEDTLVQIFRSQDDCVKWAPYANDIYVVMCPGTEFDACKPYVLECLSHVYDQITFEDNDSDKKKEGKFIIEIEKKCIVKAKDTCEMLYHFNSHLLKSFDREYEGDAINMDMLSK